MSTVYGDIRAKRQPILKAWRAEFDGESEAGRPVFARNVNHFTDSLACLIDEATNDTFTWLVGDEEGRDIPESLVDLCRLKAVQGASPSQALGFVFVLKRAIRSSMGESFKGREGGAAFAKVEGRIDQLALFSFDRYSEFREKLSQLRVDEILRGESLMERRLGELAKRERETV